MSLNFKPAIDNLELLAEPGQELIKNWKGKTPVEEIKVAEIASEHIGGDSLCGHYGIPKDHGGNCLIVEASRGDSSALVACLVSVKCERADINGTIRKKLGARKVSLANLDEVLKKN